MSRLSGFLKRSQPAIRERIGGIRGWLDRNSDVFELSKYNGAWTIWLRSEQPTRPHSSSAPSEACLYGVEDWVYFGMDQGLAALIELARTGLGSVLSERVASPSSPISRAAEELLNSLCAALRAGDAAAVRPRPSRWPRDESHQGQAQRWRGSAREDDERASEVTVARGPDSSHSAGWSSGRKRSLDALVPTPEALPAPKPKDVPEEIPEDWDDSDPEPMQVEVSIPRPRQV